MLKEAEMKGRCNGKKSKQIGKNLIINRWKGTFITYTYMYVLICMIILYIHYVYMNKCYYLLDTHIGVVQ